MRAYSPAPTGSPLPCYIYLHGGGWWMGRSTSRTRCVAVSTDVACVVVSVDYRLAPEHKFPAAPEDCHAALLWVVANADMLGIDPARIAVGGTSRR